MIVAKRKHVNTYRLSHRIVSDEPSEPVVPSCNASSILLGNSTLSAHLHEVTVYCTVGLFCNMAVQNRTRFAQN